MTETSVISIDTVVKPAPDLTSCELAGEVVILALDTGIYFGLDEVGARAWSLIQQPRPVGSVVEILLSEYDVPRDQCETDVIALYEAMLERGLIAI